MVVGTLLTIGVSLFVAATAVYTFLESMHVVPDGDVHALVVFDEVQGVLTPGKHYIPPFFSETYPIETESMTFQRDGERLAVPEEFEDVIEAFEKRREDRY